MSLSIGARPGMNNPGDLTVTGPNSFPYGGQTGVYSSPNGLFYPEFGTAQNGWDALLDWIGGNVGTNDATSLTTPSEFASYYLNGSFNGLTSTTNNPFAQSWLNKFDSVLGASPNSSLSNYTPQQIANAVSAAEGTSSTFGQLPTATGNNSIVSGVSSILQTGESLLGISVGVASGGASTAAVAAAADPKAAQVGSGLFAPIAQWFENFIKGFEGGIENAFTRGGFAIVGILLLAAGIFILASNSKTVQSGVRLAAAAA